MLKKTIIIILTGIIALFCSCSSNRTENFSVDEIKNEYTRFHSDNDIVFSYPPDYFYFFDHVLQLNRLTEYDINTGCIIKDRKIYFSVSKQNSSFDFSFVVYETDFYGSCLNIVFERDGYHTHPSTLTGKGIFYIEHYASSVFQSSGKIIDSYELDSGEYKNIASGSSSNLSEYNSKTTRYSVKIDNSVFLIQDNESLQKYRIDEDFLSSVGYYESLKKFSATPDKSQIVDNSILLSYRLEVSTSFWMPEYAFAIYEFDPEKETFCFKILVITVVYCEVYELLKIE